jgi:hypothetical protein
MDDLKTALKNILDNGKLKIVAINQKDMSKKVKEMVMQKGTVNSNYGIKNFLAFYKENIEPKMYLMKDNYGNGFKDKFNNIKEYPKTNFTFKNGNKNEIDEIEAGDYNVSLGKYKWENNGYDAEISLKIDRTMQKIDNDKRTNFSKNVLFEIPIDGEVDWGTSFTNIGVGNIYLSNYDDVRYAIKNRSGIASSINAKINNNYEETKDGKLMTISKTEISASLSNPIMIETNIIKGKKEESAGVFYEFKHNGKPRPFQLKYIEKNTNNLANSEEGPFYGYELCGSGDTDSATGSRNYYGLLFTNKEIFNKNFSALAYVPAQVLEEDTGSSISVKCIKTGTISAKELIEDAEIGKATGRGEISLHNDKMKVYERTQYNLQNLLGMVRDEKVCIKVDDGKMELSWNTKYFTNKIKD